MNAINPSLLAEGLSALNLSLPQVVQARLLAFGALLLKWNKVYNLTAIRRPDEMVSLHLLDSLSVIPHLKGVMHLADVGSGGGLPGIPLAIACPELRVSSIEVVNKKVAFQQQAKIELALDNLTVISGRVECLRLSGKFDGVISRAFSNLSGFIKLAGGLVGPQGRLYAMKGVYPEEEAAALPEGWHIEKSIELMVPNLDVKRHLIILAHV